MTETAEVPLRMTFVRVSATSSDRNDAVDGRDMPNSLSFVDVDRSNAPSIRRRTAKVNRHLQIVVNFAII